MLNHKEAPPRTLVLASLPTNGAARSYLLPTLAAARDQFAKAAYLRETRHEGVNIGLKL